ncbi:sarcoplasmic reticulum histidine-rich calcium-binding precursor [Fusarium longipes]|uniref:Sarcoplasmic reticulum histidine-rich calcium-binding n=1 Tax=Fusarium longipes TaxID=694270 RepID=A0A395SBV7_9HYPO|nr:sarcoplasmic reticulum histidine-rich calcium-binding precursor [Fusarium longipes]
MSSMAESESDQSDHERPTNNPQSNDDSSDDNESSDESSDDSDGGGLLDIMAADDSDEESSDEDDNENEYPSYMKSYSSDDYFPQFCRLPIELRHRIWELFCPELRARYRVLDFIVSYGTTRHPDSATASVWTVRDGLALEDQTKNLRTVFAVHQESRAFATNAFPNSLSIDAGSGDAIVRFNRKSDVVLLHRFICPSGRNIFHLPDFASEIKNLAISGTDIMDSLGDPGYLALLNQFTQLESFYINVSSASCKKSNLKWCTSDMINHYQTQTYEKQPGLGEDLQFLWCWPDLERYPDFARYQVNNPWRFGLPEPLESAMQKRGIKIWPMVAFEYESGLRRFELLQTLGPDFGDDTDSSDEEDSDDDDENGTDLDQYESDGIDDDEIVETYEDSDEEGISLASGSPAPTRQNNQVSDDEDDEDGAGANFSEPEPDPEPESAPVQRGRKRRVVSDSDDEDEEEVQPSTKRARVIIDSDDEDDEPPVSQPERSHKRSRTVVSDDEDEDDEQGGVSRQDSDNASDSSSGSEEEESEDSDEDDAPPTKLSLAERLRLHREENPVDNEDSDDDASSRTADEESEDDEDDDEEERNPFMMGMADESDGEGEDYDEDDY